MTSYLRSPLEPTGPHHLDVGPGYGEDGGGTPGGRRDGAETLVRVGGSCEGDGVGGEVGCQVGLAVGGKMD